MRTQASAHAHVSPVARTGALRAARACAVALGSAQSSEASSAHAVDVAAMRRWRRARAPAAAAAGRQPARARSDDAVDLDRTVFTTEAHPLRRTW